MKYLPLLIALTACSTPTDPRCDAPPAHVEGPTRADRAIRVACDHFSQHGATDLSGVSIYVSEDVVRSMAILQVEPEIYVNRLSDTWERELYHEIWHVLLWRANPEIDPRRHHLEMLRRRLCVPIELCGYRRGFE